MLAYDSSDFRISARAGQMFLYNVTTNRPGKGCQLSETVRS